VKPTCDFDFITGSDFINPETPKNRELHPYSNQLELTTSSENEELDTNTKNRSVGNHFESRSSTTTFNQWFDTTVSVYNYVMGHIVVDPIIISKLSPDGEMHGFISPSDPRSGGDNNNTNNKNALGSPRTTIALDSASSVHLIKDEYLLQDISETTNDLRIRTTDSEFVLN